MWANSTAAGAAVAMRGQGLRRQTIELAVARIALDPLVEARSIECVEPRAEFREFARGELFDRFLDVFDIAHICILASFDGKKTRRRAGYPPIRDKIPGLRSGMTNAAPRPE